MGKSAASIIGSISCLLIVFIICASILYGCSAASDKYYKAQAECVNQGGSWISQSQTYSGNCVFSRCK